MTTYEKLVKGATKVKVAPPKTKYIEPILMATNIDDVHSRDNLNTIMRTLAVRLQDLLWSVVYKLLIVLHIMAREGVKDVALEYLADHPNMLNLTLVLMLKASSYSNDVRFVIKYSKYLQCRVKEFVGTGIDYVRDDRPNHSSTASALPEVGGRLRSLTVEKGLLRETTSVQKQIDALLKNTFMENEINNDIVLTAFRLLVNDLLALFQELNEGVINLLEHYFEMSKVDAESALKIYKKFVDQTKYVIDYLRVAKHLEYATKLHVPTIKHAPTALTSSLEEYLDDPNFETNRRQYLLEKRLKDSKGSAPTTDDNRKSNGTKGSSNDNFNGNQFPQSDLGAPSSLSDPQLVNGRVASLIVQQSTFNPWGNQFVQAPAQSQQSQAPQQIAFVQPLQTGQAQIQGQAGIQPAFTGAGFGGYGLQPQGTGNPFLQQNVTGVARSETNPFLVQSQSTTQATGQQGFVAQPVQTLLFIVPPAQTQTIPQQYPVNQQFTSQNHILASIPTQNGTASTQQPLVVQNTNSNPFVNSRFTSNSGTTSLTFANNNSQQPVATGQLSNNATGNPFKVSQATTNLFNSVQSGQQPLKSQPTAGGLERLPTVALFPETIASARQENLMNGARVQIQQQQELMNQMQRLQQQNTAFMQNAQQHPQQTNQVFQGQYPQPLPAQGTVQIPNGFQLQGTAQFQPSLPQNGHTGTQAQPQSFDGNFSNSPFALQQMGYAQYLEPPSLI